MPGKNLTFTTHVDPVSPPPIPSRLGGQGTELVEAPGTAPGSVTLIPSNVYRHSRKTGAFNIVRNKGFLQGRGAVMLLAHDQTDVGST